MKIRHKQTGYVVPDVEETTTLVGYKWVKQDQIQGADLYFSTVFWEPVPDEVWEYVTAGCHVYQDRVLYDGAGDPVCEICDGYRLCNVTYPYGIHTKTAFIIERKRPA